MADPTFRDSQTGVGTDRIQAMSVVRVGDRVFSVTAGDGDELAVFEIDTDTSSPTFGQMGNSPVSLVSDTATFGLTDARAIDTAEVGGTDFVFVGGDEGKISVFSLSGSGGLSHVQTVSDGGALELNLLKAIKTVTVDNGAGGVNTFVVAGGHDDGLSVFQVGSTGTLTNVANVTQGGSLNLDNVEAITSISVPQSGGGSKTFVIAGGTGSDGVSVFEMSSAGALTNTANVDNSILNFLSEVTALESATINGKQYLFTGSHEDGISVFEISASGTLTQVGNLGDSAALHLRNLNELQFVMTEGTPQLFVGGDEGFIDVFTISVSPVLGTVTLTQTSAFNTGAGIIDALDAGSGFVVAGDEGSDFIFSFTAPCFVAGTRIATPGGEVAIEALGVGDLVLTMDRGAQRITWIGSRCLRARDLAARPDLAPVRIPAGALGGGLPRRDLWVSPQHRMLLSGAQASLLFDCPEVLVAANSLVGRRGIGQARVPRGVTYLHLMFDRHEIVFAEGAPSESFNPGPAAIAALGPAQRAELAMLFPDLQITDRPVFRPARLPLKAYEGRTLALRSL